MPDYQAIVEKNARELNATIVPLMSREAMSKFDGFAYQHALDVLAEGHGLEEAAFSDIGTRQLFVDTPVKTELGCFIALHELGHIAVTQPFEPQGIECEAKASQWAYDHIGFQISPHTAEMTLNALATRGPCRKGTYAYRLTQELKPIAKRAKAA